MKKISLMLLIFIAAFYLLPIMFRPLMTPDEFRYAELPREMLERGDFVTPKLLNVRYFEKTPMGYWFTAVSFKLFGQNAFALRLIPLLGALGSAFLLGWWCRKRKYSLETALNAAFLYISGPLVVVLGNFATLDSFFTLWTTGSFVCFSLAMESKEAKERILLLAGAGVALGCGFLTKGFLAFALPGLAVTAYLLWQRRWKEFIILPWIPLIVALLVIAPWGIAIHKAEPDFWRYFIVHEHFQRFTDSASGQHSAPFWLLLPFLALGLLPAIFPVLAAMSKLQKNSWSELWSAPEFRFALCALVLPFVFLSASDGKLPTYVLPCFAPAAMMGALILDKMDPERSIAKLRQLTTVAAVILIIIGSTALLAGLFYLLWGTGFVPSLPLKLAVWTPFLTTVALGMVVSGTVFFINRKSKLPEPASFFTLFAGVMLICAWFMPGFTAYYKMPEYELLGIASKLSAEKIKRPRIITHTKLMHPVAWCFKDSTIQLINKPGEMRYGHKYAVANGERPLVLSVAEVAKLIRDPARQEGLLIIMLKEKIEDFCKILPPGKPLNSDGELFAFYYQPPKENKEKK